MSDTYTLTIREHEMGEQPFIERTHESLGHALADATACITTYVTGDPSMDAWVIADATDSGCEFIVHYTCTESDPNDPLNENASWSTDYILEVRRD